jgi:serine/threonine protein kinase
MDMLKQIVGVVGSPSEEDLSFVRSEKARAFMTRLVSDYVPRAVRRRGALACALMLVW